MRDLLWPIVARRIRRSVPPALLPSILGDLAEDYARRRAARGPIRARLWLIREGCSLTRAYQRAAAPAAAPVGRLMIIDDLRHVLRRLTVRPGMPLVSAGLLALAIGLATAMFSIVDSLMLRPSPFPGGSRLVEQSFFDREPDVMEAWRASGMFEAVEAAERWRVPGDDEAAPVSFGASVTPGMFTMLGARAMRGRVFDAGDAGPGRNDVVLLSERMWRSVYGADESLLGERITLGDRKPIVVGVMPETFRFPTVETVAWKPLDPTVVAARSQRAAIPLIVGRLAPDVPWTDAERRVQAIATELARIPPNWRGPLPLHPIGGAREVDAFAIRALWMLGAGVTLVFLVLCANVASLLLADLSSRRREFGMCSALGASRLRLLRRAAAEHALIAAAGVVGGVGVAWSLTSVVPEVFVGRTLNVIDVDLRALATACTLGVAAVVLAGLVPAWLGTRGDPLESMRGSRESGTETRSARLLNRGLLAAQIAFACSLLVGAGVLARSFANLAGTDRGVNIDGIAHVRVSGLDDAFPSYEAMWLAVEAIEQHFRSWPAISQVALSRDLPPGLASSRPRAHLGAPGAGDDTGIQSDNYRVSASFFDLFGIPILRGRAFRAEDGEQVAVVGQRLAEALWPGLDPVGRAFSTDESRVRHLVVGVAREIRLPTLDGEIDRPEFYEPLGLRSRTLYLNVRCRAACPSAAEIDARIGSVHPALVARLVRQPENAYVEQLRLPRAVAKVGGVFAIVAVLTAAAGLFSVLTCAVGRRRREFGIRTALGASPGRMRWLVFGDGMAMVVAGGALGALGGWLVARSLSAFHYGVTAADPVTWSAVIVTLAVTALGASWRPARHAMRVDPVKLLREE